MAAEDKALKVRHKPAFFQLQLHLETVGAGCAGDPAGVLGMYLRNGGQGLVNRLQTADQALVAPLAKDVHPGLGQGLAGVRLDELALVMHRLTNKMRHALGQCQPPAGLFEHVAQDPVGDGFAVNQHAIAIK